MNNVDIFRLIGAISRKATTDMNQQMSVFHLENNLFLYLNRIIENEGITQSALADTVKIDKTTLNRSINKLEKNEFLYKKTNEINKKNKLLFPTKKALSIYPQLKKAEENYVEKTLSVLTIDELTHLKYILIKLTESID